MKNITIQLVKIKSLIENDSSMNGATSKIIAYVSIEVSDGIFISGITIKQDIQTKAIRVIFPCRKLHNESIPFISFRSKKIEKEICIEILSHVRSAIANELENKEKQ